MKTFKSKYLEVFLLHLNIPSHFGYACLIKINLFSKTFEEVLSCQRKA